MRFPERKMKIADVFSAIEKQTDYTVAYNESVLDAGKVVTVPERKSLTEVLTAIPDFDSLKIPFFLRSDNQYIVKSTDFSGGIASPFRAFERSFVHRCKQVG